MVFPCFPPFDDDVTSLKDTIKQCWNSDRTWGRLEHTNFEKRLLSAHLSK